MRSLQEKVLAAEDQAAVRTIKTIAQAQLRSGTYYAWQPDMLHALSEEFEVDELPSTSPTEGELARQALLVLAEDPRYTEAIGALIAAPPDTEKFLGVVESVLLATAVIVVLQTRVRIERDKDGRWNFEIDKPTTSDALLKDLVRRLLAFAGNVPEKT
jgi:hypothetical protein